MSYSLRILIVGLAVFQLIRVGHAQIVINEVSSAGTSVLVDENNDQEDWIELKNLGASPVDLKDHQLIYQDKNDLIIWTFPSIVIGPQDHLVVFCSKKDRRDWFDHWEVPLYPALPWKYFPGTMDPPANWKDVGFNDGSWASGQAGIGYGDGDDSTVIAPVNSLFMRNTFLLADTSIVVTGAVLLDYDDGFVAYLNGVEVARANVGIYGDEPSYNAPAYEEHEAQLYQTGNPSGIFLIDSKVMREAKRPGLNVFTIQTHNYPSGMDDLSCIPYFLIGISDTNTTYYPFSATVNLHTNFSLDADGCTLFLKDPGGQELDQQFIPAMMSDHVYSRFPDGTGPFCLNTSASPDTVNSNIICYTGYAASPVFSSPSGFYSGTQTISITCTEAGDIRYTLDGTDPLPSSTLYTTPLSLSSTQVVKAKLFPSASNKLPGAAQVSTYFINENIELPVFSLSTAPGNLFDWNYGIYMLGPDADTTALPYFGANFWKDWERTASVEYFENNQRVFSNPCGIKIQGNFSKSWPQKGFTVKLRDNFGSQSVPYVLFPDKPFRNNIKTFNIRNAGSDWNTCHMRDRFLQKHVQDLHIETMDGRPCVLFINGMYWGVYELREKQDDNYVSDHVGYSVQGLDFLEFDGSIIAGENKNFLQMVYYAVTEDMSQSAPYDSLSNWLDIENFCDYFITETYAVNIDWLGSYTNNIKYWRAIEPDSKWRYVLWDTDLSLGFAKPLGSGGPEYPMLSVALNPPTPNPHSMMLASLMNNVSFKHYFINRYADLLNTHFLPNVMIDHLDELSSEVEPEMARHFALWGNASPLPGLIGRANTVPEWKSELDSLKSFCQERPAYARDQIQAEFGLTQQVDLTLKNQPSSAGDIHLNTITPASYPWTGVYYTGVPVTVTPLPKAGYKFSHWSSDRLTNGVDSTFQLTIDLDSNTTLTAHYVEIIPDFHVYPNPFSDHLTVEFELLNSTQVDLRLIDMTGKTVVRWINDRTKMTAGIHRLDLSIPGGLKAGVYIVHFQAAESKEILRVIKL